MISRRHTLALLAAGAAAPALLPVRAQGKYPDKPIRLIVPFGPGGIADVTSRLVGEKLGQQLGQQVVVVNQPGPWGVAAARAAMSSPADGYTLILFTNGTAISVPLVKELGYDPVAQFVPVSLLATFDVVFFTGAEQPYRTLADLLAAAKANAGKLNIGTIAIGSTQNLSAHLFLSMAGITAQVVPFRTSPDAINAVLRKDVDLVIDGYVTGKALATDGKLRILATSGPKRFSGLPAVPTVAEAGVPGYDVTTWNAVFAPVGTPGEVVATLNSAIRQAVADPVVAGKLNELGIEPQAATPEATLKRLKDDIARWGEVITRAGIARQ